MSNADWANKDFYTVLGVAKDADPAHQEGLPQAGAREPPRLQAGRQGQRDRFKQVAEAYDVLGDAEKRKKYDEMRSMFAGGGWRRLRWWRRRIRPDACSATRAGGGGGFGDMFGDLFGRGGGGSHPRPRAASAEGRRRRDRPRRSASPTRSTASRSRCA